MKRRVVICYCVIYTIARNMRYANNNCGLIVVVCHYTRFFGSIDLIIVALKTRRVFIRLLLLF